LLREGPCFPDFKFELATYLLDFLFYVLSIYTIVSPKIAVVSSLHSRIFFTNKAFETEKSYNNFKYMFRNLEDDGTFSNLSRNLFSFKIYHERHIDVTCIQSLDL